MFADARSVCSTTGGLGRARVVSRRDVLCFIFLLNNCSYVKCLFVRIDKYQSEHMYTRKWLFQQEVLFPVRSRSTLQIPEVPGVFFERMPFFI